MSAITGTVKVARSSGYGTVNTAARAEYVRTSFRPPEASIHSIEDSTSRWRHNSRPSLGGFMGTGSR